MHLYTLSNLTPIYGSMKLIKLLLSLCPYILCILLLEIVSFLSFRVLEIQKRTHEYDVSDTAGSEVKFDEHGDGLARYEILNFRKSATNGTNGYHYRASKSTFDFFPSINWNLSKYGLPALFSLIPLLLPSLASFFVIVPQSRRANFPRTPDSSSGEPLSAVLRSFEPGTISKLKFLLLDLANFNDR